MQLGCQLDDGKFWLAIKNGFIDYEFEVRGKPQQSIGPRGNTRSVDVHVTKSQVRHRTGKAVIIRPVRSTTTRIEVSPLEPTTRPRLLITRKDVATPFPAKTASGD
jgi:hypothetical protein